MFVEWGISLRRVEKESLLKGFLLFFLSQSLLVSALFFLHYTEGVHALDEQIYSQMRLCSLDLHCEGFILDFVAKKERELYRLYKDDEGLHGYFPIPGSYKNVLKTSLEQKRYEQQVIQLRHETLWMFVLVELIVALLSLLFVLYALAPLRNALLLTEEFVKDILHDVNTPLSTLRLNLSMLKENYNNEPKIERMERSIQSILSLQSNLRAYLHSHERQKEHFLLDSLLQERLAFIEGNYPHIQCSMKPSFLEISCNKDAFVRVVDNLLSNAAKYNKKGGSVTLYVQDNALYIEDTGKGIKNPKKVFERFYKEQERGVGIGLHIVKKLCDELGIVVSLQSEVGSGSRFRLDLSNLIMRV